jgi:hypothetical protein
MRVAMLLHFTAAGSEWVARPARRRGVQSCALVDKSRILGENVELLVLTAAAGVSIGSGIAVARGALSIVFGLMMSRASLQPLPLEAQPLE